MSGKTSYLRKIAQEVQANGKKAIVLEPSRERPLWVWFNEQMGLGKEYGGFFDDYLTKNHELVIIVDQIEHALVASNRSELQNFVLELAQRSTRCKKFVIILSTADPHLAAKMLNWNNSEKIRLVGNPLSYRWDREHCEKFLRNEAKNKLIEAGVVAGSVGFLLPFDAQCDDEEIAQAAVFFAFCESRSYSFF